MKKSLHLVLVFIVNTLIAQESPKRVMDHNIWGSWNSIESVQMSNDGKWIAYLVKPGEGDASLYLYNSQDNRTRSFIRASTLKLDASGAYVAWLTTHPFADSRELKRKKKDVPGDSLTILNLHSDEKLIIPDVNEFSIPDKWSGVVVYQHNTKNEKAKAKDLIIHHVNSKSQDTLSNISNYVLAEEHPILAAVQNARDSTLTDGVLIYRPENRDQFKIIEATGVYKNLVWDKSGEQLVFMVDTVNQNHQEPDFVVYCWKREDFSLRSVLTNTDVLFSTGKLHVSANYKPTISESGKYLYIGIAPPAIAQDTFTLPEEIVDVEVWTYQDELLYTMQENQFKSLQNITYLTRIDFETGDKTQLAYPGMSETRLGTDGDASHVLLFNPKPYQKLIAWEGNNYKDVYLKNVNTGELKPIAKKVSGYPMFSPQSNYVIWYQESDTAWFVFDVMASQLRQLTFNHIAAFYDETNDRPMHPSSEGILGWSENDKFVLIYDGYDVWRFDLQSELEPERLTDGREYLTTYQYIRLDPEEKYISLEDDLIFRTFNEKNKQSGYRLLNFTNGKNQELIRGDFSVSRRIQKAKDANIYVLTKESILEFPDLLVTDGSFKKLQKISHANPQQKEYAWGTIELIEWYSADGQKLTGMLAKPDNFDPDQKYPMIVNFYEKSSNSLHSYRTLDPNRSQIVYPYYLSRGYVIFNPDIPYKIGYPGESAFSSVISGVTHLINLGIVDPDRIGVQGHSWGGYQIAHLITRSNIFKCAEAGAPVVNMFSAYGGIRWGSGMSRQFQYEHTQSRIGGSIWEYPIRYLENSPLFFVDKIETPVLILHNDEDGAVPWYQGIEFFMALRRLGKPAWLLNYNGEPHWPVKWQNRVDFQKRMSQFFDYYLLDAAIPLWMKEGVPAIEKGIKQRYELIESDRYE